MPDRITPPLTTNASAASDSACRWCGLPTILPENSDSYSARPRVDLDDLASEMKYRYFIRWAVRSFWAPSEIRSAAEQDLRLAGVEVNVDSMREYVEHLENGVVGDWTDALFELREVFDDLRAMLGRNHDVTLEEASAPAGEGGDGL